MNQKKILFVAFSLIITVCFRLFLNNGSWFNFFPIAAISLFSGSILKNQFSAYLMPLATLFISDLAFELFTSTPGFYGISQLVNYAALFAITFLGTKLNNQNSMKIAGFTLGSSMFFFLVSNFGTFLSGFYGYTFQGFLDCYIMAIPFYKYENATSFFVNSLAGDFVFSALAFGAYYFSFAKKQINSIA